MGLNVFSQQKGPAIFLPFKKESSSRSEGWRHPFPESQRCRLEKPLHPLPDTAQRRPSAKLQAVHLLCAVLYKKNSFFLKMPCQLYSHNMAQSNSHPS